MRFLAVTITGLSLIAPAAHAFELLNKIGLPKAEYFIVQQIYSVVDSRSFTASRVSGYAAEALKEVYVRQKLGGA
jgi:hypothetical protein